MGGVATGKFKGCETCRKRRVKCDNERPFCSRCTRRGTPCEGYELPRIFITSGPEAKGRVSMNPRRSSTVASAGPSTPRTPRKPTPRGSPVRSPNALPTTTAPSPSLTPQPCSKLEAVPVEPLAPAWIDKIPVSCGGHGNYTIDFAALHTALEDVARTETEASPHSAEFTVKMPAYTLPDIRPRGQMADYEVASQCLLHIEPPLDGVPATGICLFLFEPSASTGQDNDMAPWMIPEDQLGTVRKLGPDRFRDFPNHHYFTRIYRPDVLMRALVSRKDCFLSGNEWRTVPWECHPKSLFDSLLDSISLLPTILARADRVFASTQPTVARRLKARDVLNNCLLVEKQFDQWLLLASQGPTEGTFSYWCDDRGLSAARAPFVNSLAFKDGVTAVSFLYYWAALVVLHQCIEGLHLAACQPVVDEYLWGFSGLAAPEVPNFYLEKYQQSRVLAANICSGLDFALANTWQPDLLVGPLTTVMGVYGRMNKMTEGAKGGFELLWCEEFKAIMVSKAEIMRVWIEGRPWHELAQF